MIESNDRRVLRDLARRVADIAASPIQAERRELWKKHNRLQPVRPMILVFPEGSWEELLTERDLACEGDEARRIEWQLRSRIYYHEHFSDDTVIEREYASAMAWILFVVVMAATLIILRSSREWVHYEG